MKRSFVIILHCITILKGSVLQVEDDSSCVTVKSNLVTIHDNLHAIQGISNNIENPAVPPTYTLQLLNTELEKYKISLLAHKDCVSAESKAVIETLPANISALNAAVTKIITQYTKINDELNKQYEDECKDPSSQSSKALADQAAKVCKTISEINENETVIFNQILQSVEPVPSLIFTCLMTYKLDSIDEAIKDFSSSVNAKIATEKDVIGSNLSKNLTNLEYAVQRIMRFDQKHQKQYLATCKAEPNVGGEVDACTAIFIEHFNTFHNNVSNFYTNNVRDLFKKLSTKINACADVNCIDACIGAMQTMKNSIMNDIGGFSKIFTSLIQSTTVAAVKNFTREIDRNYDCYLNILASGASDITSFKMSLLSLLLLVLVNISVIKI